MYEEGRLNCPPYMYSRYVFVINWLNLRTLRTKTNLFVFQVSNYM